VCVCVCVCVCVRVRVCVRVFVRVSLCFALVVLLLNISRLEICLSPPALTPFVQAAKLDRYAVGKTKLFLKFYHLHQMEKSVERFYRDVVRAQSAVRRKAAHKIFAELQRRAKLEASERAALDQRCGLTWRACVSLACLRLLYASKAVA
jgi:hypothetical protein